MKKAFVIRLGGWGDAVMISPVLKALKDDGYHVTLNVSDLAYMVLKHDPHVDRIVRYNQSDKKTAELSTKKYWDKIANEYDRVINLSGVIEGALLIQEGMPEWDLTHEDRHEACNVNYYDFTMAVAGYPKLKGQNGNLYFTIKEHQGLQKTLKKHEGRFKVLWVLSGSSFHKVYPYTELIANEFLDRHPDAVIYTSGDIACRLLEWDHPRVIKKSDIWDIRESMLMTKYADLVIGPETGVLAAAACYDTPKIILMSHASEENLTKHWENVIPIIPDVPCHPCHKLHMTLDTCELGTNGVPICMEEIDPLSVLNAMEEIYSRRQSWQHPQPQLSTV